MFASLKRCFTAEILDECLLGHCSSLPSHIPPLSLFVRYRKRVQTNTSQHIFVVSGVTSAQVYEHFSFQLFWEQGSSS